MKASLIHYVKLRCTVNTLDALNYQPETVIRQAILKLFNNFLSRLQTIVDECVKLCMKEYQGKIEVEKHMKEAFCQ